MNKDLSASSTSVSALKPSVHPIVIIGSLFFIFGFITWLNSVLIPYLQIACELNNFESYLVAFAFYIAYFFMAIPSSWLLKKTGFKKGMSAGLVVMAIGALFFIPAALTRIYSLFLAGLFIQGTGLAVLQTASNPYITIIGPRESAAKRISIMGVCNKLAGAIAPIILGAIALKNADTIKEKLVFMNEIEKNTVLNELASRVIAPYVVIIIVLSLLAILIYFSSLPEIDTDKEEGPVASAGMAKKSIFQFPHLMLGVLAIFLYVGVEVLAGDTIISYASSYGIPFSNAKFFTTSTLISMIVGYLIGIATIPRFITQERALQVCALSGIVFSILALTTTGFTSVLFISLLGLSNSLMWPAIWPLALAGLGRFTKLGSSLLIMGIAGGAVLPLVYGWLADLYDARTAYWILVPCYLYILYYALKGYKERVRR